MENSDHENGIRYHSRQIDGHRVETTITGGTFVLDTAAGTVGVADRNGKVVATMSTTIPLGDHRVALAPAVDRSGTTMTLMPVDLPAELQHAAPAAIAGLIIGGAAGIFVGALTGAIVGLLGGLLLFVVGAIPGLLLGPLVGGFFGGVMGASTGWNLGNCGGISCPNPPPGPAQPAATPKPAPKRR
ncbi:MAG: hypothetical protein HOQ24_14050 [Mycobacteriaceae bacterium]|nr:hypothetical protein [Mycobacteriaceae bacterium]